MPTDLNSMNMPTGSEYEVFDPENAWPDAPTRIVVQTNKMRGGTYQLGTGESGSHWIRSYAGGDWTEWQELVEPPPPPVPDPEAGAGGGTRAGTGTGTRDDEADDDEGDEADDEYRTTDMKPKRGPGRPRKS